MEYSGIRRRFCSYLIDAFICTIMLVCALIVCMKIGIKITEEISLGTMLFLIIAAIYFISLESSKLQATFGKLICRTYVVDKNNKRLSLPTAISRFLSFSIIILPYYLPQYFELGGDVIRKGSAISWIIALLFALLMIFGQNKSNVIDLLSGTKVLKINS